jgi:rhodanese-related sulfurtransferase
MHRRRQLRRLAVAAFAILAVSGIALQAQNRTQQETGNSTPQVIALEEFKTLYARGGVLAIDVRSKGAFAAGHIDGAINVPLDQLESHAADIRKRAKNRAIVTYCSCPAEHASLAGADLLIGKGLPGVRALKGGYDGWVEAGGRIIKSFHHEDAKNTKSLGGRSGKRSIDRN